MQLGSWAIGCGFRLVTGTGSKEGVAGLRGPWGEMHCASALDAGTSLSLVLLQLSFSHGSFPEEMFPFLCAYLGGKKKKEKE